MEAISEVDTSDRNWEHRKQGIPAEEVELIPDGLSVWACVEQTAGRPVTITIYVPDDDGDVHVTAYDGDFPIYIAFDHFGTMTAATEYAQKLINYYSNDNYSDNE